VSASDRPIDSAALAHRSTPARAWRRSAAPRVGLLRAAILMQIIEYLGQRPG
jgi:hypothetical protein